MSFVTSNEALRRPLAFLATQRVASQLFDGVP
jgi:hypothetical protein